MEKITLLSDKSILLGVTGSIACYKAIDLASKLTQAGALVDVILTTAAQQFVTPLVFQAVTGRPVYTDLWHTDIGGGLPTHIAHIGLAERTDLFVIAPMTANHLAKLAHGLADDLLSLTALSMGGPLLVAPAGDGHMLDNPAVVANIQTLRDRGVQIIPPESGRHASGEIGHGRLPDTDTLIGVIRQAFGRRTGRLRGQKVVITAGGTHEALDPIRFITNRSSGKQGYALAQAAIDAGGKVTLISAPTGLPIPVGVEYVAVESAVEMLDAVLTHTTDAAALIMAAAVADYRPVSISAQKIKKADSDMSLSLVQTQDILQAVGDRRRESGNPRVLVGFAAETQDIIANAQSKLERKNVDLIVANDVTVPGAGFAADTNIVTLLHREGTRVALPQQSKAAIAETIIGQVIARLG